MQNLSLDNQLLLFINEVINKRIIVSILFGIFSIIFLTIGIYLPKVYESKTSIIWTNYNPASVILQQPVRSGDQRINIRDQIELAKEIIFSNKNLDTLIQKAQLDVDNKGKKLGRRELEVLKGNIRSGLQIYNSGTRIIVIAYRHPDPETAYLVVSIVSELFLQETRNTKNQTSQGAYDFINRQVIDYKNKLDNVNKRIIEFRKANVDLDSDTRLGVNARVNNLRSLIRETSLQLTEASVQKSSLEEQMAEERRIIENQLQTESRQASSAQRESANSDRLQAMQNELDALRLSYTESYPDIIQLKEQIKNLKGQIDRDENINLDSANTSNQSTGSDVTFVASPLYVQLASDIADVETLIQTLRARVQDTEERLASELQRTNQVNALESQLEEMTRDLDVTQTIYDDLLTRRENARVSLNLQLENQVSTFKIQEPAVIPLVPVGLRFLHFVLGSMPVALMIPLGIIFALIFLDPRIRHEDSIDEEILSLPVIGTIEHYSNEADKKVERKKTIVSVSIIGISFVFFCSLILLKINQFIGA